MTTLVLKTLNNYKIRRRILRLEISPEDKRAFQKQLGQIARGGIERN